MISIWKLFGLFYPVLAKMEDDISHPAFSNLFLKYSQSKSGDLIVKRNKRGSGLDLYLGSNLFLDNGDNGKLEYEIDGTRITEIIENGESFSSSLGLVTEPCIALKRNVKIKPGEERILNLIISVSEDLEEIPKVLDYYKIQENVKSEFNIARAKVEEESRYLNLSRNDIETLNLIYPYIIHPNPMKSLYIDNLISDTKDFKQSDFWKYGISGDIPIMLVITKDIDDVYVVKEMLKVHENLRIKGIKTDLVIIDYEKNVYERYVKEQIIQEILNMQIGYLQNISGGIFLLNANEIEDEDLFKFRANIIINASKGTTIEAIKEMEEEYKRRIPSIGFDKNAKELDDLSFETIKPNIDVQSLKFYNGFGGFSGDGKEYIIKQNRENKLPTVWSNVLANEKFGSVVTNNLGGFTYSKNSRLNRITSWANMPSNDIPSEIIYIKDLENRKTLDTKFQCYAR